MYMTFEILMPFYGSIDHFKLAVQSVIDQDDPDWGLTVVDDVYPDLAPGMWLEGLADSRITYIRNTKNLRPSRNYNKCLSLASSDFITLLGCDDIILPGYIRRVRELLAEFPTADILQPGVSVISESGRSILPLADTVKGWIRPHGKGPRVLEGEGLAASLLRGNWTYFPSLVWRTERLRNFGFRTDLDVVQDLAMLMQIVGAGGKLVLDDTTVFLYRRHASSVSSVTGPDGSKFMQERKLFQETTAAFQAFGWRKAARISRRHTLSRLNALTELPGAIKTNNTQGKSALIRHILGMPYRGL
jgi:glycosyltransferase involved in cell wall biosynthesis